MALPDLNLLVVLDALLAEGSVAAVAPRPPTAHAAHL
jgi:hypothetical protein